MKNFWLKLRWLAFLWATILIVAISGCKDDTTNCDECPTCKGCPDVPGYTDVNEFIREWMYFVYYWNTKIDSKLLENPRQFKDVPATTAPKDYFKSLLYDQSMVDTKTTSEYDRWSFLISYEEYAGVMVEGEYKSYGYYLDQVPADYSVRVCYVYEGSPMAKAGIERGYELVKLNGTDVMTLIRNNTINNELAKETNRFLFADRQGEPLEEKTISAAVVKINPILRKERYSVDGKNVGYIVYNSFITASEELITNTLKEFNDVDELILDLRYNGGGDVSVADHICEYLLPETTGTDSVEFAKYVYSKRTNDNYKDIGLRDEFRKIKRNTDALNLSRLFVIVSDMTASASEEVINSMRPFINEVILVGTKTEGKPVGMLALPYPQYNSKQINEGKLPDWIIAAINFRIDNMRGEGSYFAGMSPDREVGDDLYHDFGTDSQTLSGEECLQTVLEYIKTGGWPVSKSAKAVRKNTPRLVELKGIQIHAGCI
jgi:C-terminal processing protease CtpA/Prc